ncbi:MAG TPA: PAS domain-containing protein, partial [Pseudolabrys sp.]|nr:PAS domain-containing protein [Pseudolabrys sp.]
MPESIRTANERLRSRPWRDGFLATFIFASFSSLLSTPVRAETRLGATLAGAVQRALATLREQEITALTLVLALLGVALLTTVVLFRLRRSADRAEFNARDEAAALRAEVDRLKALLLSEPQVLVTWPVASEQPEIIGDTTMLAPGGTRERVLAFGTWLEGAAARRMEQAVDTLRNDGRGFAMTVTSRGGRPVEVEGRVVAGRAILRLRDVSGIERELLDLAARHDELLGDVEIMRSLLDTLSAPVWARDAAGRLIFVNTAYARAVEAENPTDAVARELELLDQSTRTQVARARVAGQTYVGRLPAVTAGVRRVFDVIDASSGAGSAGMAIDRTEAETLRAELMRMTEAHRRVLDQLSTGVAVFNIDRKLTFFNSAFRSLFELDAGFLDQGPTDAAVLDFLRDRRK